MRKKINSLQSIRFIMVIIIMISHLEFLGNLDGSSVYDIFFHNSNMAVNYFFILSGFGLTLSFCKNNKFAVSNINLKNLLKYARERVNKHILIYAVSMAVMVPLQLITEIKYHDFGVLPRVGIKAFLSVFLIQSMFGIQSLSHAFNGVCWFFLRFFFFIFFYPLIEKAMHSFVKNKKICYIGIIADMIFIIVLYEIFILIEKKTFFDELSYASPYIRIWYFILGMFIAYAYKFNEKMKIDKKYANVLEFVVSLVFILWFFFKNTCVLFLGSAMVCLLDFILPTLIIFVFSFQSGLISNILNNQKMVKYGDLSIYLYFIHYPVRNYLIKIPILHSSIGEIIMAILVFLISFLIIYLIDKNKLSLEAV